MQIRDGESCEETWPRKTASLRKTYKLEDPAGKAAPGKTPRTAERNGEEVIEELGEPVNEQEV